jgi:hypothetical protein
MTRGRPLSSNRKGPGKGLAVSRPATTAWHHAKEHPLRKTVMTGVAAGALLVGAAGVSLSLAGAASAADPTPSPTTTTTPTTTPSTTPSTTSGTSTPGFSGAEHGPGLDTDDLAAASKALGMTEAALRAELEAGKTAADVAKAKGVDVQVVTDAVIAYDKADIAAAVKAGTMTQAQADERLANLTQHVTDEVNGVDDGHGGFGRGHGGRGPRGGLDGGGQLPAASPTTGTGTGTGA